MSTVDVPQPSVQQLGPDLFHYRKWMNALLWGCIHDRIELRSVETELPARHDCAPGVYECGNGHLYRRGENGRWARIAEFIERVA